MECFEVTQLFTAFLASLGFAMLYRLRKGLLLAAAVGGLIDWATYLFGVHLGWDLFFASLAASAATELYSEIAARRLHTPATIIYIPGMIPLVPGGSLYHAMEAVVVGDTAAAADYANRTLQCSLAIAAGLALIWSAMEFHRNVVRWKNHEVFSGRY
ncbi:MAG: threonine/serine exporter family protein [Bacillota bacterium]|uniref:Uncharacterized membrane protein YjjB, DUF3815 family n=1 Tax=[Clostridium] aminophilum TaxID=1526 RepID=A0A1I6ID18_9FIRM|nr:threonine/serine exporter family protein [[Clostridium] aminophilum]MDT3844521.1 threonine/serine exporter family protein [Bacillota bacterium]SFR64601.1 Uncharacterized membrane protein YjjB, DUF3815 family [[Clostridium] aminophilum]